MAILAANARLGFVPLTRMQALTYDFRCPELTSCVVCMQHDRSTTGRPER